MSTLGVIYYIYIKQFLSRTSNNFSLTASFSAWQELHFFISQNRTNYCNKTSKTKQTVDHFSAKNKLCILDPNFTSGQKVRFGHFF